MELLGLAPSARLRASSDALMRALDPTLYERDALRWGPFHEERSDQGGRPGRTADRRIVPNQSRNRLSL
jgi:hypothetical protein